MGPITQSLFEMEQGKFDRFVEKAMAIVESRPRTLIHGDLRCDNVFEHNVDKNKQTIIDWQTFRSNPLASDFMQAICMLDPITAHADMPAHLKLYHDKLVEVKPEIAEKWPYETMMDNTKLLMLLHL